jgi:hypothetical protein
LSLKPSKPLCNGTSVVYQHVDAAETFYGYGDSVDERSVIPDVHNQRQRLTTELNDLFGDRVYRAWKFGMRRICFCCDDDPGAVSSGPVRDCTPNPRLPPVMKIVFERSVVMVAPSSE